ncbi:2-hydroxyacid dehydrogenase [Aestuariivirga litoralis]|uniref:2-hydroxyacid dehydrogenase n=1 Tax=Aestuariivirga litoralis TaxID=2650924 RepID=UPI0018C6C027|nr:glyoxylate/hydroxypyruvate reductase A [Aestuariivirga litoralis]MBG1232746.1 glyoxylate/hydroxypyruvate reductase A [Aestuariivirga litoralis]
MSALVFVTPTWDATSWAEAMRKAAPGLDVSIWPDSGKAEDVTYACAWLPPPDVVKSFPNLKVIFSLGAGVDAILSDPTLPVGVPIVRVNDPDLTNRMSEYVVLHVLMHHRQQRRLDDAQAKGEWNSFPQHAAKDLSVGIMGLGVLGQDAARKLAMLGFNVRGWSRTKKDIPGVESFDAAGLDAFLSGTDILVSLLPATVDTDGILNTALFKKLSRRGPLGAPVIINAGRGRQQNEDDILACLEDSTLLAATLDVFHKEPLSTSSALWKHPRVTITPHAAADSEPATICSYVAEQIRKFEAGAPLENLVDTKRGY